jgi:hypothetical protein
MAIFFERTETEEKITIRYKNMIVYYLLYFVLIVLAIGTVVLSYLSPLLGCIAMPAIVVPLFLLYFFMHGVNSEVKEAMKNGKVQVSGSRFSSSNPLTFEISKNP